MDFNKWFHKRVEVFSTKDTEVRIRDVVTAAVIVIIITSLIISSVLCG